MICQSIQRNTKSTCFHTLLNPMKNCWKRSVSKSRIIIIRWFFFEGISHTNSTIKMFCHKDYCQDKPCSHLKNKIESTPSIRLPIVGVFMYVVALWWNKNALRSKSGRGLCCCLLFFSVWVRVNRRTCRLQHAVIRCYCSISVSIQYGRRPERCIIEPHHANTLLT